MKTLVIGHRNPDMDSIVSAIGYAEFKRATGMENAIAARCGNTNARIDFALRKFGVDAPMFVPDVYPRVEDVMQRNVVSIHRDAPIYQAMTRFGEAKFRGLPVVGQHGIAADGGWGGGHGHCHWLWLCSGSKAPRFGNTGLAGRWEQTIYRLALNSTAQLIQQKLNCVIFTFREAGTSREWVGLTTVK